ncbi:MAG TPA: peptidoglycan-binding domain-containing protein [Pseudomonadales bacterium]
MPLAFAATVPSASAAATAPPELIQQIERDLTTLGYDPGPVDGSLDSRTQLAIARFEAASGLPFSGQPSFELAFALRKAIAAGAQTANATPAAAPAASGPAKAPPVATPASQATAGDFARMATECESRAAADHRFRACAMLCRRAADNPVPIPEPGRPATTVVNMGAATAALQCPQQYESAVALVRQEAEAAAAEEAKLAAVDRSAVGAPGPGDYVYAYEYGPHLRIEAPNARLRAIKVPSHAGKPRFGYADTLGVEDRFKRNTLSAEQIAAYKQRLEEMRLHRTAYALLVAIRLLEPRLRDTDRSTMYVGGALDRSSPQQAEEYQARLLVHALAAIATGPDSYGDYFCGPGTQRCHPPTPGMAIGIGWGGARADEFAQRDAFQTFMRREFDELLRWSQSVPRDAVMVSLATIGEYDFDNGRFTGALHRGMQNRDLVGLGSSPLLALRPADGESIRQGTFDLPMPIDEARSLRERLKSGHNVLYAVAPIRFGAATLEPFRSATLDYEMIGSRVKLYFDEALTEELAEVSVIWR